MRDLRQRYEIEVYAARWADCHAGKTASRARRSGAFSRLADNWRGIVMRAETRTRLAIAKRRGDGWKGKQ